MPDSLDVFHWKMDGTEHKRSVDCLRLDIIQAYETHIPFPISLILQLLPLQTEQGGDAAARGDITFEGNVWTNEADDDLWMEFQDPVIQTFSATIPRIWTGSLELSEDRQIIKIEFVSRVDLEIPRLAEMGVGRSSFQILDSITASPELSLSVLKECDDPMRETWLEANLVAAPSIDVRATSNVGKYARFDTRELVCPNNPFDTSWYVVRRGISSGFCFENHGKVIEGGQLAYNTMYGPSTYADCESWISSHCENDLC